MKLTIDIKNQIIEADWFLIALLASTIIFGPAAFYPLFFILCVVALTDRNYSLPLLFFSGIVKATPVVASLAVDFTLLALLYFLFATVKGLKLSGRLVQRDKLLICGLLILMLVIVAFSFVYTPATSFFLKNSAVFLVLNLLLAIAFLVGWPQTDPKQLLNPFLNFSLWLGLIWVGVGIHNELYNVPVFDIKYPHDKMWHISSFGEDYMAYSAMVIMSLTAVAVHFFFVRRSLLKFLVLIILFYGLLASPARGLMIGFLFSVMVLFAYSFTGKVRVKTVMFAGIFVICIAVIIAVFHERLAVALGRLTYYDPSSVSIGNRLKYVQNALDHWTTNFILGTGIDSVMYYNGDLGRHVHNVLIESVVEFGIIGGLPFLFFFFLTVVFFHHVFRIAVQSRDSNVIWIGMVFVTFFVFGLFSGSLSQIRNLWLLSCIVMAIDIDCFRKRNVQGRLHP